jgi:putative transposase
VLVDTLGLVWGLLVLPADVQDRDGAKPLLAAARDRLPGLKVVWADGGYAGQLIDWVLATCGWVLQTVLRPVHAAGFVVLPKRWIVERTFAWLGRYRRLSKDYEANPRSSETWIYIAMIHRMARLLMTD